MATLKPELKKLLDKYDIDPRDKTQVWDCHGVLVLYHKAYEMIAAREGILLDMPVVLEANGVNKTVALCVRGYLKDRKEWSIGEAAPGNNKNAYVYAMAEKRAKDRVIGKLVGLSEYIYSESEADEFAQSKSDPAAPDWEGVANEILGNVRKAGTVQAVNSVLTDYKRDTFAMKTEAPAIYNTLKSEVQKYRNTLPSEAS